MARDAGTRLLGELPLDIRIREGADGGRPVVVDQPQGQLAEAYRTVAGRMVGELEALTHHQTGEQGIPEIVVE